MPLLLLDGMSAPVVTRAIEFFPSLALFTFPARHNFARVNHTSARNLRTSVQRSITATVPAFGLELSD
jgi:hypothetical protein